MDKASIISVYFVLIQFLWPHRAWIMFVQYLLSWVYFGVCMAGFITFQAWGSCSIFNKQGWVHWSFPSILLDRPFLFPPVWSLKAALYTAVTREHDSANGTCFLNEVWSFVMYFRGHSLALFCLSWTFLLRLWQFYSIQHGLCTDDKEIQRL